MTARESIQVNIAQIQQKEGDHSILMSDGNQCNASFESSNQANTTAIKDENICGKFNEI